MKSANLFLITGTYFKAIPCNFFNVDCVATHMIPKDQQELKNAKKKNARRESLFFFMAHATCQSWKTTQWHMYLN